MNDAIVKVQPESTQLAFTAEQERMIRDSFANGATKEEFQVLLEIAKLRKLNPLLKQIHFVKRWDKKKNRDVWSAQVGIDGFRAIAERTGKYDGQDEPEFGPLVKGFPEYARVKVYRKDWSRPAVGVAYWSEYVQSYDNKPTRFWADMPRNQLAKCAEALALRKAFPEDLSGLYTDAEMQQADNDERPPTVSPYDDGRLALPQADTAVFAKLKSELDGLEAQVDTCRDYDKALKLREWLGSPAKPSELNKTIQRAREAQQLDAAQHKELSKVWQRSNRKLAKLELTLQPDASASFADDPESGDGALSEEEEGRVFEP